MRRFLGSVALIAMTMAIISMQFASSGAEAATSSPNWLGDVNATGTATNQSWPILGSDASGTLYLATCIYSSPGKDVVDLRSSMDGGRTWTYLLQIGMGESDVKLLDMVVSEDDGVVILCASGLGFLVMVYPSMATTLVTTGSMCSLGTLVLDGDETAHCVIQDYNTFLYCSAAKPWDSWSTPETIATDYDEAGIRYHHPRLAYDPATGNLLMAYNEITESGTPVDPTYDFDVYVRSRTASGWEAMPGKPLTFFTNEERYPDIAVHDDEIVVVWTIEYAGNDWDIKCAYSADHGASYSNVTIAASYDKEFFPTLNRYAGGLSVAFWSNGHIDVARYSGSGQWSAPEAVSDAGAVPDEYGWPCICGFHAYTANTTYGPDPVHSTVVAWSDKRDPSTWDVFCTSERYVRVSASASPETIDATQSVQFSSDVLVGTPPFIYAWDFGDGGTSSEADPSHVYDAPGDYQVGLTVNDYWGKNGVDTIYNVHVNPVLTVTGTSVPQTIDVHQTVSFTCTATHGTPPYFYYWDFDDGANSTAASPTHQYDMPGSYYPTVYVADEAGMLESWGSPKIQVNPLPTFSVVATPNIGLAPLDVSFTCYPENGTEPYTFAWDFGDGDTSASQNPVHEYSVPGQYSGTLNLTDAVGVSITKDLPIVTVLEPLYVEPLATRDQTDIGHAIGFECLVAGGLPPYHFLWEFGDGGTSELPDPDHTFAMAGDYSVRITVRDSLDPNTTANQTLSIKINPLPEVVGWSERTELNLYQPLAFNCTVHNGTPPFQYLWDLGDGNTSDQPATEHAYDVPGVYSASILVVDALGEDSIFYLPPILVNYLPVAVIHTYLTSDLAPATVRFECFVTWGTPPYNYTWDFGDGGQGFGNYTDHTFLVSGDYTVTVLVVDDAGSGAPAECHVLIFDVFSVQATVSPTIAIVNETVWFNCTVSGGLPPYSYRWDFGDGNISMERNATHAYSAPGLYEIALNCSDSNDPPYYSSGIVTSVQVSPPPLPPTAPLDLTALPGDGVVRLSWSAPASDGGSPILRYEIHRGSEPPLTYLANVSAGTLWFNDTQVLNGLTYHYLIAAVNSVGLGEASEIVSATPMGVPSAPLGVEAVAGDGFVLINWSAPADDGGSPIVSYRVHRTLPTLALIADVPATQRTHNDTSVSNGVTYSYRIAAVNAAGEGEPSGNVTATPRGAPSAPRLLTAVAGNAQVTLSWSPPSDDGGASIVAYTVYRGTTPGGEAFLTALGNVLTHTDAGLTNGQTYYYTVSAMNSVGDGPPSDETSATPNRPAIVPSAPQNLVATPGDGQVHLTWNEPTITGDEELVYHLFRDGALVWSGYDDHCADVGLTNDRTYAYKVSANNTAGWGPNSTEVQATPISDDGGTGGGDDTMLLIGIGAVALLAVAGAAVVMMRRRR